MDDGGENKYIDKNRPSSPTIQQPSDVTELRGSPESVTIISDITIESRLRDLTSFR